MTNEEKQALIADCKDEIIGLKQELSECGDDGYAQMHLESKLLRQQIALAALTAQPVKLPTPKRFDTPMAGEPYYTEAIPVSEVIAAIRTAGYQVRE